MAAYSNFRALRALVRASLQSISKSPSAIIFGVAFPLIFILVFGFLGGSGSYSIHVTKAPGSDTLNPYYMALKHVPVLKWDTYGSDTEVTKAMSEGNLIAQLKIEAQPNATPKYVIHVLGNSTEPSKVQQLQTILTNVAQGQNPAIAQLTSDVAKIEVKEATVREYKAIDVVLPGQLGFSLLAGSVFGTAFIFYNFRQTLVLKRFFATPVRRSTIVLGEGIARMIFQLLTAIVIIMMGYFAFGFTLVHGAATAAEMLAVSALAILVFMGFGFIISGIARSDSAIPPFANLITLPQFLLAGTFFPIEVLPKWLQPIPKVMPLTYLNDALRKISFEGAGLWAVRFDMMILAIWGIVLYAIASRVFKWE